MTEFNTTLSIIIPAYNCAEDLHRCLTALFRNKLDSIEIIVVDDGSDDPAVGQVARSFNVNYVRADVNVGRGPARNLGAARASAPYLLFLDADVLVQETSIEEVQNVIKENPSIVSFFGSYDDQPGCLGAVSQYRNLLHHYTHQIGDDFAQHFWTGFGVVKTAAFKEINGFDQGKWAQNMEEVDLGARLNEASYKIEVIKGLQVKHLKSYSIVSMFKSDLFDRAIPWTLYLKDHTSPTNNFVMSNRQRFSAFALLLVLTVLLLPIFGDKVFISSGIGILGFTILNWPFLQFCRERRGAWFKFQALFLHMIHIFSAGLGYVLGTVQHLLQDTGKGLKEGEGLTPRNSSLGNFASKESE